MYCEIQIIISFSLPFSHFHQIEKNTHTQNISSPSKPFPHYSRQTTKCATKKVASLGQNLKCRKTAVHWNKVGPMHSKKRIFFVDTICVLGVYDQKTIWISGALFLDRNLQKVNFKSVGICFRYQSLFQMQTFFIFCAALLMFCMVGPIFIISLGRTLLDYKNRYLQLSAVRVR